MIERYTVSGRSPEWLSLRQGDLTASNVGTAIGLDPFKTPLMLYAEKAGLLMADADNQMMRRGRWLEPAVVAAIREQNPDWDIRYPLNVYLRDPELRLGATPDAIAETDLPGLTNLQLKVIAKPEFERRWGDGVPLNYILQTLTEAMLMEAKQSKLAALVIDTFSAELFLFDIPRHAGAEERIRQIARDFWDNMKNDRRPVADYQRDAETLAQIFPVSVPEPVIDLTGDNLLPDRLEARAKLKDSISAAEAEVSAIDTEIKDKLGEAERATLPGWKISLKTQHRREVVLAATSFRRLRVTREKEA